MYLLLQYSGHLGYLLVSVVLFLVEAVLLSRHLGGRRTGEGGPKHMAEAHLKERVHLDFSPHLGECSSTTENVPQGDNFTES